MTHVLTFVSSDKKHPLSKSHVKEVEKIIGFYDIEVTGKLVWLAKDKAADLFISGHAAGPLLAHIREFLQEDKIDLFTMPRENRRKKLLLADMDSTIVIGETLDDLAEYAGIKEHIAAITARAMEGKIDFKDALRERIGLLKGLPIAALNETLAKTQLSPGAETFVHTMKQNGAACVLVSGGFTFFTGAIAERVGFDAHHGNTLNIENNALAGTVGEPILDKHAKVDFLDAYRTQYGLSFADALTIGDGANDLPMLKKAGLGIGYHPKEAVAREVANFIAFGDLTAALYAQGYTDKDLA
jgi:phosphoserine phosphatase